MQPETIPDSRVSTVVIHFFEIAAQVHAAAKLIHEDDGEDFPDARKLSTAVAAVAEDLGVGLAETGTASHDAKLAGACRKVCLDLLVHLDVVSDLQLDGGTSDNPLALCDAWPPTDVAALGNRLKELLDWWKETPHAMSMDLSLVQGIARLKVQRENADELQAAEEREQRRREQPSDEADTLHVGKLINLHGSRMRRALPGDPDPAMLAKYKPKIHAKPIGPSPSILQDFILDTLEYKSMRDREEEVVEAHNKTLEWIFADEGANFAKAHPGGVRFSNWLQTSEHGPIYWISGKPGSGKSTLMRFLFESDETTNCLQKWAGDLPVATAGFFFWTSGSREQRSQTGLLRYLLHQLLSDDESRRLIPVAFSDLWAKLIVMSTKERIAYTINWTVTELMKALDAFMDAALQHMSVCLFIDGLDEFEGDHREIINFFKALGEKVPKTGPGRVKLCLSSRPWDVFEAAFQYSVPNLKLQELTTEDMHKYAVDRLNGDVRLRRALKSIDPALNGAFVKELVDRADGVFLWIRLAIDKIVQRFRSGDTLDHALATLRSLPTELDPLFEKLLFKDQTAQQISETASMFQLIRAREIVADSLKDESSNSLTVWEVAFALHKADDDAALDPGIVVEEASDEDIIARCETTKCHARDRFAGLLEVHEKVEKSRNRNRGARFSADETAISVARRIAQSKLIYIHRTVRDWLMSPTNNVRERLDSVVPESFDAHLRLLRSYVLRLKFSLEEPERHRRINDWWPDIALAMTHARYVSDNSQFLRDFVNQLDDTHSWYWLPKPGYEGDHWARAAFGSYEVRMKAPPIREPFLCLAVKFGLTRYIREELQARCNEEHDEDEEWGPSTPLLSYAVEFLCSRALTIYPLSDPKLVVYLLTHPLFLNPGPDYGYVDFITKKPRTPWIALLRHLRDARRRRWIEYYDIDPQGLGRWASIVEAFVKLGKADVDAVVAEDMWDPEITALGVMELLEGTYGAHEMRELRRLVCHGGNGPEMTD